MNSQNLDENLSSRSDGDIRLEATERSISKMKITDLSIDCLEEVFEFLDLINLLNVADSNKRLRRAASFVFHSKHGKKAVTSSYNENADSSLQVSNEIINVYNRTDIFRFLRCFGCVTPKLDVSFLNLTKNQIDGACHCINEYCAESLIELTIFGLFQPGVRASVFEDLKKPFVNIEKMILRLCQLGKNVTQINKWFPKIQHLELLDNQMVEESSIETHFPNLRYLKYLPTTKSVGYFSAHLEIVIRLNPNLRCLHISIVGTKVLQHISKCIPQLEELTVEFRDISEYDIGQVHFKSLKKLEIITFANVSDLLSKVELTFDQLEEFYANEVKFDDLLAFVMKCPTLKKLKIRCHYTYLSKENALQVAKALPLLSELKLYSRVRFSVDEAIRFVNELDQLREFHFCIKSRLEFENLRARLGDEWKASIDVKMLVILQRSIG